jgi:hypothetical protein
VIDRWDGKAAQRIVATLCDGATFESSVDIETARTQERRMDDVLAATAA